MANKLANDIIGIYIDVKEITISIANIDKNKVNVSKLIHIPTDYKAEGIIKPLSLNNDFFSEKQKWAASFRDIMKKLDLKTTKAVVSLSHDFSITRFFIMPSVERKFWNKAISIESKKYIPISFDELGYDFYAYNIENSNKVGVCFSVTPKKTIEFLMQLLRQTQIDLLIAEPSAISIIRFFNLFIEIKEPSVMVYFSADDVYTIVDINSIPFVFRYISFSNEAAFSQRQSLDIKGSIIFAQRNISNIEFKKILFSGENSDKWIEQVERETGIKPQILKIDDKINTSDFNISTAISISASLKYKRKEKYSIDVSENEKNKRVNRVVKNSVFTIAGFISGIFIFLFFINFLRNYLITSQIQGIASKNPEISEFEGLTVEQANDKIIKMRKVEEVFSKILTKREYFAPKLSDLCDIIPKDIWLKDISFTNPISVNADANIKIEFTINGETYLSGDSRTYYMDYFMKEIKKSKNFIICTPPMGGLDYNVRDSEFSQGNLNSRAAPSTFRISCYMDKKSKL